MCPKSTILGCAKGEAGAANRRVANAPNGPIRMAYSTSLLGPKPYSLIAASTRIEEKTPRKVQTANVMSALGGGLAPAPLHLLT